MKIHNLITIARILMVPVIVWLLISDENQFALVAFAVAAASDGVDGWLARVTKTQSEVGAYLDPLADKLLLVSIFATLGVIKLVPAWLVITVISRDVLIIGGLMLSWFLDHPLQVKPLMVSKANTLAQLLFVGLVLTASAFDISLRALSLGGSFVVAGLTLASGLAYVRAWIGHMNGVKPE